MPITMDRTWESAVLDDDDTTNHWLVCSIFRVRSPCATVVVAVAIPRHLVGWVLCHAYSKGVLRVVLELVMRCRLATQTDEMVLVSYMRREL